MSHHNYVCSHCGEPAYYDGRCSDGPVLMCNCVSPRNTRWVDDGRGGYTVNRYNAEPVEEDYSDGGSWGKNSCAPGPSGLA